MKDIIHVLLKNEKAVFWVSLVLGIIYVLLPVMLMPVKTMITVLGVQYYFGIVLIDILYGILFWFCPSVQERFRFLWKYYGVISFLFLGLVFFVLKN